MSTKEAVFKLMDERKSLESDLATFLDVLKSQGVDEREALVDAEGYPRGDVDVHQIRIARNKIVCLRNDLKEVMKKIEDGLHDLHGQSRDGLGEEPSEVKVALPRPFAKIDVVTPTSPAQDAGVRVGDKVAAFGEIDADNFSELRQIGELVNSKKGQTVTLKVVRDTAGKDELVRLVLTPREWEGRGLLGCNIVPLKMEPEVDR